MNWKKLLYAAVAALVVFALLMGFGALLSEYIVYALLALAVGAVVYFRVALWEIQAVAAKLGVKL